MKSVPNICCQFNPSHFCMRCLRDHCMDCIKYSKGIEHGKGKQGTSLQSTKPACLGCGNIGVWKGAEYKDHFVKMLKDDPIQASGPIDELIIRFDRLVKDIREYEKYNRYRQR